MNITFIGCPFQTSYGDYIQDLGQALKKQGARKVQWIGSKCGCGDREEQIRNFITRDCDYFELPVISHYVSTRPMRRRVKFAIKHVFDDMRARKFEALTDGEADAVHFQQTLGAFGSDAVFRWLKIRSHARKVVTVHELDAPQLAFTQGNRLYNLAHAVLVHDHKMGERLVELGVEPQRIHPICHGARISDTPPKPRAQRRDIMMFAGHTAMRSKGVDTAIAAYAALKRELGDEAPRLLIHGYFLDTPPEGLELARIHGVQDSVIWLNCIDIGELYKVYAQALLCILPYTGSFAGLACSVAAAQGVPVVGTDIAGIPEHLGDDYTRVAQQNPEELCAGMLGLVRDEAAWNAMSSRAYARAKRELDWNEVARRTLAVYGRASA